MTRLAGYVIAGWMALGGMVQAGETVVVELFTSQGCSSCPPADRILGELAQEDDVIALAYHVDYWDYLGWKDDFASPKFTERQRSYARAKRERTIYTPQMVIGGIDHVVGSKGMKVAHLIRKHADRSPPVNVRAQRSGGTVTIQATASGTVPEMVVQIAVYSPRETVDIRRGENAGRRITYHNVVRGLIPVGTWNGQGTYSATANVPDGSPLVVLVQGRGSGPIMGATRLP